MTGLPCSIITGSDKAEINCFEQRWKKILDERTRSDLLVAWNWSNRWQQYHIVPGPLCQAYCKDDGDTRLQSHAHPHGANQIEWWQHSDVYHLVLKDRWQPTLSHPYAAEPRFQHGAREPFHRAAYGGFHGCREEDPALCDQDSISWPPLWRDTAPHVDKTSLARHREEYIWQPIIQKQQGDLVSWHTLNQKVVALTVQFGWLSYSAVSRGKTPTSSS